MRLKRFTIIYIIVILSLWLVIAYNLYALGEVTPVVGAIMLTILVYGVHRIYAVYNYYK